ncbi:uncharacterized protein ACLA_020080 [Aspergillus clavatus NRRL 1]|uniref:Uncharacterized protein n=1 Tax=Aspergillus clavatus (strain ATCC 1007 / CBS 513.65 / DSM 816 / NCTC 3887 / NRRL 1 / QM 1276 / 107) TaxID=344612 RepID=A1CNT0_ASPCL|nr:uncharacterized protein ACLA_020080 [Aspergillus clavatus NRRL 1]EAW07301.1 conserved hypothetical protein [Aspergillus clavatus NRRL 1]
MSSTQYQELWLSQDTLEPTTRPTEPVRLTWKILAFIASTLLLIGYLIMPIAFEKPESNPQVNVSILTIVAMVLVGFAYALSFVLVCFQIHQRTYLCHSVFLPCLTSNLCGLFNLVFNIFCRNILPLTNLETIAIGLSCAFVFLYALGALWVYGRSIADETRVRHASGSPIPLTEEEMQRQQLLRLLQGKQGKKRSSAKALQKTFRVDVPEVVSPGKGWHPYMGTREQSFV